LHCEQICHQSQTTKIKQYDIGHEISQRWVECLCLYSEITTYVRN
jgi:hypothetical protein